jgi:hypothetical protein
MLKHLIHHDVSPLQPEIERLKTGTAKFNAELNAIFEERKKIISSIADGRMDRVITDVFDRFYYEK